MSSTDKQTEKFSLTFFFLMVLTAKVPELVFPQLWNPGILKGQDLWSYH